ncbi:MAG: diguanylate cyclase [Magnetococcus sp. DMHC-1]|nr:diguanylate cyclase [Magnetococcales bacterium]
MFKQKFLRGTFIVTFLVVVSLPLYTIFFTYPAFVDVLVRQTEQNAVQVATHVASYLVDADSRTELTATTELIHELHEVARDFQVAKYRMFSPDGRIIHASQVGEVGQTNQHDYFREIVARGHSYTKAVAMEEKSMEGEKFRKHIVETYAPVMRGGRFLGAFEIYLDFTSQRVAMEKVLWRSSAMMVGMGMAFLLLVWMIRRSVLGRVTRVAQAMARMGEGHLDVRAPVQGHDELSDMARIFNRMGEELQSANHDLQNEQNKLTTILLSAREGIVVTNAQEQVVLVNPAAEDLLGKSEERIVTAGFFNLIDDPDYVKKVLERSGTDMPETVVYNNRVLNFYAATIHTSQGEMIGSAALLRDVTAEKKLEEKLRQLSYTDGLTGLHNRRRMQEILQDEMQRARRHNSGFGVLMLDVDHFKKFNDQYGHDQGDRVLQTVASAMKGYFRTVDSCCRYGGEEFCVIMPYTVPPGLVEAADRFRQKVEKLSVNGLRVTISIGAADYSQLGESNNPEEIIKLADQALYEAKRRGRNQVVAHFQLSEPEKPGT